MVEPIPLHGTSMHDGVAARLRAMVFEFDRTASRLLEMQSREYLAERRRLPF